MRSANHEHHHLPQPPSSARRAGPTPSRSSTFPSSSPGPARSGSRSPPRRSTPSTSRSRRRVFHGSALIDQPEHTGLGWDFAGTVLATGPGVDLAVGTRVAGLVDGFDRDFGTYAEQLVLPAADLAVVPDGLDLVAAATVPLNGLAAAQIVDLLGDGDRRQPCW